MRFPYIFSKFTAADVPPPQDGLSEEKRTEIAQYANAIYYNDFIVTSIMGKFADKDAIVVYIPDHGEALYDRGSTFSGHVEEHPTKETLEVPVIFWASAAYRARHPESWQALSAAVGRPFITADFFHTLLDFLDLRTPAVQPLDERPLPGVPPGRAPGGAWARLLYGDSVMVGLRALEDPAGCARGSVRLGEYGFPCVPR
jgi:Predicted membrane-associated, metal-dependent hydrolase